MAETDEEGLLDGCFFTWVQVTEHYSRKGEIDEKTKNFRGEKKP